MGFIMEKICIVKRRQEYSKDTNKKAVHGTADTVLKADSPTDNILETKSKSFPGENKVKIVNTDSDQEISINLTPEQLAILQTSEYMKSIFNGTADNPTVKINHNPDGRIMLNVRLNESPLVRMLRSDQVCLMLQISRSLLMKLVRGKKIRSYKIGRLRRFLLEDILNYLTGNEEYFKLNQ
jgi:excisionase family DNA binding protein